MKKLVLLLCALTFTSTFMGQAFADGHGNHAAKSTGVTKIAFGSCAYETAEQPIWNDIAAYHPDMFLFIGDNMYADVQRINGEVVRGPVTRYERFQEAYRDLAAKEEFARFRQQFTIHATWDDHDYGVNDGYKTYDGKQLAKAAYLDFFDVPMDDPRRYREGIYHTQYHADENGTVQIIMLDTRYFRDAFDKLPQRPPGKGAYIPTSDTSRSLLGDAQWQWLEEQLQRPADVRLIVSSIQVVAEEHGWETWGNMPHEKQRLFDLIEQTKANGVVFLSGDRHLYETSKDDGSMQYNVPYPLWDITGSGMTQKFSKVNEMNSFRQGSVNRETHYAAVEVHWAGEQSFVRLKGIRPDNEVIEQFDVPLSQLQVD